MPDQKANGQELQRGLRPLALFAMLFMVSVGGPYGLEEAVPEAGPGLAILVLAGMGLVWAGPYALIVAELVSAIPQEGGPYLWYRALLNRFWAFQFACLDWITWVLDAAIYPPLLAAYLIGLFLDEPNHLYRWFVCLVVIWGCTWVNIRGVRGVGRLSVALSILALAPVVAMIGLGWSHISFSNLQPFIPDGTPPQTALNYALIFAVWCYSGFGGMAYASEEIVDPQRTYPRMLAILLPLTIVVYVLPLMVGLGVTPEWDTWGTAHFNQMSLVLGGVWLVVLTSVAAQCANLGLFNGELLITSRLPYAMAKDGVLPPFFAQLHPRYGTPSRFLLLQALFYSVVTYFFGFIEILVVSSWIAMPSYCLTAVMPLALRVKHPGLRGPFRIPGGAPVLVLCAIPLIATSVYVLLTVSTRETLIGAGFLAIPPILFLWSRWAKQRPDQAGDPS